MKIYTKTGDEGETGLFGGARVSKASERVEAYGHVDELNSVIGLARSFGTQPDVDKLLHAIQNQLFQVGAELATVPKKIDKLSVPCVAEDHIAKLEQAIDQHESNLAPLTQFVLPGGAQASSALHLARCVCRRAERSVVGLAASESVRSLIIIYLNRLSDLLFVLARATNAQANIDDVPWLG